MKDKLQQIKDKTKGQLINELVEMQQKISRLDAERNQAEKALGFHVRGLSSINKLAGLLNELSEPGAVAKTGLDGFLEAIDLHLGALYLVDETSGKLLPVIRKGITGELAQAMVRIPPGVSVTGTATETGGVITIKDMLRDERIDDRARLYLESEKIRCFVSVPLKSGAGTIGVIDAGAEIPRDFSDADMGLLETLGSLIGVAIERAHLVEKINRVSVTDELTGLFNRQQFDEVLKVEIYRSQRYGSPFSLVMADFDGFKEYNEKFGQTSGDSVIKALAQALKAGLRKSDVACCYGGDGFTIILPETVADRAMKVVERIRSKFSQILEAQHSSGEHGFGLSAGIAEFPQVATTADDIVCMAECALYYAKMRGGNTTVLLSDFEVQRARDDSIERLHEVYDIAEYVEARDPTTYGHSENVAIILKPCQLTKDEWRLMKTHSVAGAEIVGYVKGLANLAPIILHHHEWYDGTGYPDGLKGEEIPLGSRIISIADAYDTMTSERAYSKAMLQESALDELRQCAGTQFDPHLVDVFLFDVKIQALLQKRNLDDMKAREAKCQHGSDENIKYGQDLSTHNFN